MFDLRLRKTIWWPLDNVFFFFLSLGNHLVVTRWCRHWIVRDHLVVSTLNYKGPLGAHQVFCFPIQRPLSGHQVDFYLFLDLETTCWPLSGSNLRLQGTTQWPLGGLFFCLETTQQPLAGFDPGLLGTIWWPLSSLDLGLPRGLLGSTWSPLSSFHPRRPRTT